MFPVVSRARLFTELSQAASGDNIAEILAEHASDLRILPVGVHHSEIAWKDGDGWNNRHAIEAMSDTTAALYERAMNGFDAMVQLFQDRNAFPPDVTTPTKAMEYIAGSLKEGERPVFFIVSDSTDHRTNCTIVDVGAGQPWYRFGETFMSIGGKNKIGNVLMAGSYGQGGHAIYRDSAFTLIYSRCHTEPNQIGFTVVHRVTRAGWKAPSYVYLVDENGRVPVVDINDVPSKRLLDPKNVRFRNPPGKEDGANEAFRTLLSTHIIMPPHGTVVRTFDMGPEVGLRNKVRLYNQLRKRGFGSTIPLRFIHGTSKRHHSGTYGVVGIRHTLNDSRRTESRDAASRETINPALFVEPDPVVVLDGQAELSCWVLDRKNTAYQEKFTPVQSVLGEEGDTQPSAIFITLNGQTHNRMPIFVSLKKAGLPHLNGHIIVEINCDRMDSMLRSDYFTSNREAITVQMDSRIRNAVIKYLQSQEKLSEINDLLLHRMLRKGGDLADKKESVERFAEIMGTPFAGSIFSLWGNPAGGIGTAGPGRTIMTKGMGSKNGGGGGKSRPVVLMPVPTKLEIRTKTVEVMQIDEYIRISSDAMPDWRDAFSIKLPSFLKLVGQTQLQDGRMSWNVSVNTNASIDEEGEVEVTIDRSRAKLPPLVATSIVTVVKRERVEKDKAKVIGQNRGLPDLQIHWIGQDDPQWTGAMQITGEHGDRAALRYVHETGMIRCWINTDFAPYKTLVEEMTKQRRSEIVEQAREDYEMAVRFFVLADMPYSEKALDNGIDPAQEQDREHKAATVAMTTYVMSKLTDYANLKAGKRATVRQQQQAAS